MSRIGILIALSLFATGAAGSGALHKNSRAANIWSSSFAALASLFGFVSAAFALASTNTFTLTIPLTFPLFNFSFQMDQLAAFFVLIISLVGILASIYGVEYMKHYFKKYDIGTFGFFYNLFLAGMILVVLADNALVFLIAWEIMSLTSYFLVVFEKNERRSVEAGSLYFIMTHIGTAFIILAFLILYKNIGSFNFGMISRGAALIPPIDKSAVFLFALIGFGTKAGMIPFHIWLPGAHPAAPSHISALMSGVMIKTGIYMIIRVCFTFFTGTPLWWGTTILIAGAISSLLGVLYTLSEKDIKKILAFSSIENIGIILLGIGSAMILRTNGLEVLAGLALAASLFHVLNHSMFKALLFMGAGSVVVKTGTRNIESYGGLIKYMPTTALFFLIGSMAISALPPLNGFASEWLIFQALFAGMRYSGGAAQWSFVIAAGSLALTGGLAAMCFVRVFGITFLGRPRRGTPAGISEPSRLINTPLAALVFLVVLLGILAGPVLAVLSKIVGTMGLLNNGVPSQMLDASRISSGDGFASVSMPAILIGVMLSIFAVTLGLRLLRGKSTVRQAVAWDCGTTMSEDMVINATSFSRSLVTVFKGILRQTKQTDIEYHDANSRYFPKTKTVNLEAKDVYRSYFYNPFNTLITKLSKYAKTVQSGNVNMYVLYMFIILLVLLSIGAAR